MSLMTAEPIDSVFTGLSVLVGSSFTSTSSIRNLTPFICWYHPGACVSASVKSSAAAVGRGSCRAVAGPPVVRIILAAGCVPEEKKASCAAMRDASSLSSAILSRGQTVMAKSEISS
jgi:hypothetical protein